MCQRVVKPLKKAENKQLVCFSKVKEVQLDEVIRAGSSRRTLCCSQRLPQNRKNFSHPFFLAFHLALLYLYELLETVANAILAAKNHGFAGVFGALKQPLLKR
jgi:hypothetical protein